MPWPWCALHLLILYMCNEKRIDGVGMAPPPSRQSLSLSLSLAARSLALLPSLSLTRRVPHSTHVHPLPPLSQVRFGVMCSEDIALGCPCLPQYLLASRRQFVLLRCAFYSAGGRLPCRAGLGPWRAHARSLARSRSLALTL